jgi:hypothetical protein
MPPTTVQVTCPRNPEHGLALKLLLSPSERQMVRKSDAGNVFEIDCPVCGRYEYHEKRLPAKTSRLAIAPETESMPKTSINTVTN